MNEEFYAEIEAAINMSNGDLPEMVATIIEICQRHMEPTAHEHDILESAAAYRGAYKRWEEFESNPSSALAATVYDDLSSAGSDLIEIVVEDE